MRMAWASLKWGPLMPLQAPVGGLCGNGLAQAGNTRPEIPQGKTPLKKGNQPGTGRECLTAKSRAFKGMAQAKKEIQSCQLHKIQVIYSLNSAGPSG